MIGEVQYGGRVTGKTQRQLDTVNILISSNFDSVTDCYLLDDFDKRLLNTITTSWFCEGKFLNCLVDCHNSDNGYSKQRL